VHGAHGAHDSVNPVGDHVDSFGGADETRCNSIKSTSTLCRFSKKLAGA
jgi:hypothetical protein